VEDCAVEIFYYRVINRNRSINRNRKEKREKKKVRVLKIFHSRQVKLFYQTVKKNYFNFVNKSSQVKL
jgi:hypothetical protein